MRSSLRWWVSKTSASSRYVRRGPDVELMIEQVTGVISCPLCGQRAQVKERPVVHYVDLPVYGTADVAGLEEAPAALCRPDVPQEVLGARGSPDRGQELPVDHAGRPSGRRSKSAEAGRSQKWRPSWPVTGTRSTTPCAPMARPSRPPIASA